MSYAIDPLRTRRNFLVKDYYCLDAIGSLAVLLVLFCGSWRVLGRLESFLITLGFSWSSLGALLGLSWGLLAKARQNLYIVCVCLMLSIRFVHAGTFS